MKKITIYTTTYCPYCVKAKKLLDRKGLKYEEIDVTDKPDLRKMLVIKSAGRKTVPQIFIGDHPIGGCDDLHEAEASGQLDLLTK